MKCSSFYMFLLFIAIGTGCEKEVPKDTDGIYTEKAYVIGIHPCTRPSSPLLDSVTYGFVLRLVESDDTVVTYNLPKGIVTRVDSIEDSFLFPKNVRDSLEFMITYRIPGYKDKYYPLCPANIYTGAFSSAVQERQITLISVNID